MADFCMQCSTKTFAKDLGDLKGLGNRPLEPGYGWAAICEGCGPTVVDALGACIADDCLFKHGLEERR